ncbi:MAG: SDR family NAD(P)-dependent oxidoreductase, partial [Chloroflexi bacterium]|nr:SDR family NAD(P)-dependent oxidoreductase [Chloroflexota bacterium]
MELKDKAAVVTGAAGGIGRGIALSLAREGVSVVIADLASAELHAEETKKLVEEAGVEAMVVTCDVTNEAEVQAMAKAAIDRFEHIDILVNNAGVISVAPVMSMTEQQWDLVIDVNLKGTFLCSKAFAAHMVERRSGRIINISSLAGRKG